MEVLGFINPGDHVYPVLNTRQHRDCGNHISDNTLFWVFVTTSA